MARYQESVLETVMEPGKHMTAEQIYFLMKEKYPKIVLATVYNNLNSLHDKGKIRKISVEGFPDRYDVNTRHDHLVCTGCGKLMDVRLGDFTGELENRVGFPIELYDLKLYYTCEECKKAKKNA